MLIMHATTPSAHDLKLALTRVYFYFYVYEEKKEEIWLSPMTKAPTPAEMAKWQHKQRHKKGPLHSGCGPTQDGQLE